MRFLSLVLGAALAVVVAQAQSTLPIVGRVIPTQTLAPGGGAVTVELSNYLGLAGVAGPVVQFDTSLGKFNVELRSDVAPQHVTNFLNYVSAGRYRDTFLHRSASLDASGAVSIVQGGGFGVSNNTIVDVPTFSPVPLEYQLPNARGTLAAARTSSINSATSQWYFNVRDNSTILDQGNGGGYTVFGRVLGTGMNVVDAMAALQRVNATGGDPSSPFGELPVRDYSGGNIQLSHLVMVNSVKAVPIVPGASGEGALALSVQSSNPGAVAASLTGGTLSLTPTGSGSAVITLQATDVNGNSISTTFSATISNAAPVFTQQPLAQTIAAGDSLILTANATGANRYQWRLNGNELPGETNASLLIRNATAAHAGTYTVVAVNPNGSATSNPAAVAVNNAGAGKGRLVNLSIRSFAGTGDQTLIVGFSLGGAGTSGSTPLLLRAVGPTLTQYGVGNALSDPLATLYAGSTAIASNNNWGGAAEIEARSRQVFAFDLPANSLDAALARSQDGGTYTMQVTSNNGGTGTALAEIYDANASYGLGSPRLVNVSARTRVGNGSDLIAGFVIGGSTSKTLLIRVIGPALVPFGVSGVLANPRLQVTAMSNNSVVAQNDDWAGDPNITLAGNSAFAFPIGDGASKDAAVLVTLPPGNYTVQVGSSDGGSGVALIEVYEVN